MRGTRGHSTVLLALAAITLLGSLSHLRAQAVVVRLGQQSSCSSTDSSGFEATYEVDHTLRNGSDSPIKVAIGSNVRERFKLFYPESTKDPADGVWQYYPEVVRTSRSIVRTVAPHRRISWRTYLVIPVGSIGVQESGAYSARIFPDVRIIQPPRTRVSPSSRIVQLYVTPNLLEEKACSGTHGAIHVSGQVDLEQAR